MGKTHSPTATSYAVGITTTDGKRRYLGPGRFGRAELSWRRRRHKAELFDTPTVAGRMARAVGINAATARAVAVYRVDTIGGRHRWHEHERWDARAAGGVISHGQATAQIAAIRPSGGNHRMPRGLR